jgi:SAM-dependent methyltransferase
VETPPSTWHHGLVAQWWAEFNEGGPEVAYFQRAIERGGQPALDVGCGTGRLLLPFLRADLDVDGSDVSPDMIALCREKAGREGLTPTLLVQPMHELDPPRRYRTIVVCGAFGLGSTRAQDQQALTRFYECLEPGGILALDNQVPYANARHWSLWLSDERRSLPQPFEPPPPEWRRTTSEGAELALRVRALELDPLAQRMTLEMYAERWRDGVLETHETHLLTHALYFRDELVLMLERAGFVDVVVHGDHTEAEATADSEFLVFVVSKPR